MWCSPKVPFEMLPDRPGVAQVAFQQRPGSVDGEPKKEVVQSIGCAFS